MDRKKKPSRPSFKVVSVEDGFIVANGYREHIGEGKTIGALHVFIQQCLKRPVARALTDTARNAGLLPVPSMTGNDVALWGPIERQAVSAALDNSESNLAKFYATGAIDKDLDTSWFFSDLRLS